MAGRFPLAVGSKANNSEPWKSVGTTCACASAYGRRDAPSPVGLCLLCLDLSVSCVRDACRLRARVFHAQRRSRHFVFDTHIKSQPARTLYDIKCVAALLIRPRKVTQVHMYVLYIHDIQGPFYMTYIPSHHINCGTYFKGGGAVDSLSDE